MSIRNVASNLKKQRHAANSPPLNDQGTCAFQVNYAVSFALYDYGKIPDIFLINSLSSIKVYRHEKFEDNAFFEYK